MNKIIVKIDRKSIKNNPDYGVVSKRVCTGKRITLTTDRPIAELERQLMSSQISNIYGGPNTSEFVYAITKKQSGSARFLGLGKIEEESDYQTFQLPPQPRYLYNYCLTGYFGCPSCGTYQYLERYQKEEYPKCPRCKADIDIEYEQL